MSQKKCDRENMDNYRNCAQSLYFDITKQMRQCEIRFINE